MFGVSVCKELPVGRDSNVAVNVVWALRSALQTAGLSEEQLAAVTGDEATGTEMRPRPVISRSEMYALCERALEASGDPALGLHWGERNNGYAMSVLPELLMNAETPAVGRFSRASETVFTSFFLPRRRLTIGVRTPVLSAP